MVTDASAPPGRAHHAVQVQNLSGLKACATIAPSGALLPREGVAPSTPPLSFFW